MSDSRPRPPLGVALDATQQAVLDLPARRSAVVLGAPGTGKTTTLVELAAHRVAGGLPVDGVLALAPRRAQAGRLRDRLLTRIDRPATGPLARTTASLAFDIARRSAVLEQRPLPVLLTGGEQDALIAQLLTDDTVGWPERLSPEVRRTTAFRTELRDLLARATERGVDPHRLGELGRRHSRPQWVAAARFLDQYLDVLAATRPDAFDPAELLALATAGVQRGTAGHTVEQLRLVLVDDLQDATEATVTLLAALADRGVTIVGFGDPDVAVDTFRGGEPDLLGRFGPRLGIASPARLVLDIAYRTPPAVRALLTATTARIGTALAGDQRAAVSVSVAHPSDAGPPDADTPILTITAPSTAEQALSIAQVLRGRHLRDGVPFADQAVVVRSGALAEPLARALEAAGVPTVTATAAVPLRSDRAARALLDVLAVALGLMPLTPESAVDLLTGPLIGLDRLSLRRLRLALRAEELAGDGTRSAGELLVEALSAPGRLATIDAPFARRAARLAELLHAVRQGDRDGASAEELLWRVWQGSGVAASWRTRALSAGAGAAEANRDLDGVVALFAAAARAAERAPGDPAAPFVAGLLGAQVPDDTLAPRAARDSVLVTTPVGVAGLQFDTVVVAGLQQGVWPNLRQRGSLLGSTDLVRLLQSAPPGRDDARPADSPGPVDERAAALSDELRLFALAISRTRRHLVLAAVGDDEQAPGVLHALGRLAGAEPAPPPAPVSLRPLVAQLRRALVDGLVSEQPAAAAALARLAQAGVPGAHPDDWHGLLDPSTTAPITPPDQPVGVSPSSVESFETSGVDWFVDRVAGSEPMLAGALGTMLHWVLETASVPDEAMLLAALEGRWRELDFEADWVGARERRIAERMVRGIAAYLADRDRAGATLIGGEARFEFAAGRALVAGIIDRIEREPGGAVGVVDLKTGKPSGHVKQQDAAEHAQLGTYQLAVRQGAIDGVDPGATLTGARLLYVRLDSAKAFKLIEQQPLDDTATDALLTRLQAAAEGMGGAVFGGPLEIEERPGRPGWRPALARIPEVCSD
ncbi:PD-(D/E)XK nuclease family protein [uncultured Amnibacterium sp.]|uniref:PD-(D/E)XK nuclease family protein n=1 Tax=uncultured Amnibacterium sp. TaxID=1631851 RepID=UPI0035CBAA06